MVIMCPIKTLETVQNSSIWHQVTIIGWNDCIEMLMVTKNWIYHKIPCISTKDYIDIPLLTSLLRPDDSCSDLCTNIAKCHYHTIFLLFWILKNFIRPNQLYMILKRHPVDFLHSEMSKLCYMFVFTLMKKYLK